MPVRRIPPVFLLYVVITATQTVWLLALGGVRLSPVGVPVTILLLAGLAFGRPVAWGILLFWNAAILVLTVLLASSSGGHLLLLNVAVLVISGVALEATLLSPPMRRHVRQRGLSLRQRPRTSTSAGSSAG